VRNVLTVRDYQDQPMPPTTTTATIRRIEKGFFIVFSTELLIAEQCVLSLF